MLWLAGREGEVLVLPHVLQRERECACTRQLERKRDDANLKASLHGDTEENEEVDDKNGPEYLKQFR